MALKLLKNNIKNSIVLYLLLLTVDLSAQSSFTHPGLFSSQAELDKMKEIVNAKESSIMKLGWNKMMQATQAQFNYKHTPYKNVIVVSSGSCVEEKAFHSDAVAAYSQALQWVVTGDEKHSKKAIEIFKDWSEIFEDIVPEEGSHQVQDELEAGWYTPIWLAAAEIIRHYNGGAKDWSKAGIKQFDNMVGILAVKAEWDGNLCCPNQRISMAFARMSIGVYSNNRSKFDSGLNYFRDIIFQAAIARNGEVMEINRKKGGDCSHAMFNIEGIINIAEMVWHQGINLYEQRYDNERVPRLVKGMEYFGKLVTTGPVQTSKEGLVSCNRLSPVSFEMAYNHFSNRLNVNYDFKYTLKLLEKTRPSDGSGGKFIPWDTLTHSGLSNGTK